VGGSKPAPPFTVRDSPLATSEKTEEVEKDNEALLAERLSNLAETYGVSTEELVDEGLRYQFSWRKSFLRQPYDAPNMPLGDPRGAYLRRRQQYKSMCYQAEIESKPDFFKQLRLLKPIATKYPALARHLPMVAEWEGPDKWGNLPEVETAHLDADWLSQTEREATFTYEDWARETDGGEFTKWEEPKVGEKVTGVIAMLHPEGAFVEIGTKTWAFMTLEDSSLSPVASVAEAGMPPGTEVEVEIINDGKRYHSLIPGDPFSDMIMVSRTALTRLAAWETVDAKIRGDDENFDPLFQVEVLSIRPFGAVVRTEEGLIGLIQNRDLADLVGNASAIGRTITVEVVSANRAMMGNTDPQRPSDFPILFSYKNAATKELCGKVEVGEVKDAVVQAITDTGIDMMVEDVLCYMKKVDVSAALGSWSLQDVFEPGETIKVYVLTKLEKSGEIRFSTRALEFKRGVMLKDKETVFERAEATAKKYFEKSKEEQSMLLDTLEGALDGDTAIEASGEQKKGSVDSILGDDDSDVF
jgi:small subunit ribosomal protein S1